MLPGDPDYSRTAELSQETVAKIPGATFGPMADPRLMG